MDYSLLYLRYLQIYSEHRRTLYRKILKTPGLVDMDKISKLRGTFIFHFYFQHTEPIYGCNTISKSANYIV